MTSLNLAYRDPAELKPDRNNARTHSKAQVEQIARSIQSTTFANPILVDEDDGIIAGHGRLQAAKFLQLKSVPVITVPGLSPAQRKALRIADNKIALSAGWDVELLKIELGALQLEGYDLELTGFSVGEIDVILAGHEEPEAEVVPAVPPTPTSRTGDIWRVGQHRIGCGDLGDRAFLARLVGDQPVDAAFLDPPYNVRINGHAGGRGQTRHREFAMASGEMSQAEFTAFLKDKLGACVEVSRPGAVHFVCMDHHHLDELFEAGRDVYGARLNLCIWNKSNAGMGSLYRSKHEVVAVYRVGDAPHLNAVELGKHGRNRTNVWDYASVNSFRGSRREDLALHPTVKPVGLVADAVSDVTRRGERVLDAFLGSGTTLIACERVGRRFVGLDIDAGYVDVALQRWANLTGEEPVLEETGESWAEVAARRAGEGAPVER